MAVYTKYPVLSDSCEADLKPYLQRGWVGQVEKELRTRCEFKVYQLLLYQRTNNNNEEIVSYGELSKIAIFIFFS